MSVRTDIGSRMLCTFLPFSISMRVTLTSGMESCSKCTIIVFCKKTLSDADTVERVCSGMVLRMTFAMVCPSVSFDIMCCLRLSFKKQRLEPYFIYGYCSARHALREGATCQV
jgi:hypothetical protein